MVSPALCMKGEKREEVDGGEVFKRWFGLFVCFFPHTNAEIHSTVQITMVCGNCATLEVGTVMDKTCAHYCDY